MFLLGLKTKQNLMIPNLRFVKKRYISHLLPLLLQCLCRITFLPYFIFVPVLTFVTWNYTTMSLMLEKKEIWLWRILIIEYSFYLVFFSHRHRAHYGIQLSKTVRGQRKADMTLQGTLFAVRPKFFGCRETNTSPMTALMSWLML